VFMGESKHPFSDEYFTAEHLLHESSHLRLTLVMGKDPLVKPKDETKRFNSPLRKDPRPLMGIIQGAYVFARIAVFLIKGI
ncbi:aKG-HExxH-type peptide beta-hydroxylase, partial [Bacillus cereus]